MNRTLNSLENNPKLFDLLGKLRTSNDTPSLISWITEDADRMRLAGILASVSKTGDPASYRWLVAACGKVGSSFEAMQNRIRPVARVLGLYNIQPDKNYYQLLGVHKNATENQIRTAYRQRARRIHPDTRGDHEMDEEAFTALTTAYKTLSNPMLRREYDQGLLAVEVWNEGPKYRKYKSKKRRRSKVKYFFLFSVISLVLAVIILFSDIFFNMSVMREIEAPLWGKDRKITSDSEKVTPSELPDSSTGSNPSVNQSASNINENLKEHRQKKSVSKNSKSTVAKQKPKELKKAANSGLEASNDKKQARVISNTTAGATTETAIAKVTTEQREVDSATGSNEQQAAPKNNEPAAAISATKNDGGAGAGTKRSEETVKSLASVGAIDKRRLGRLPSEEKVVDLIKNPPTRWRLQSFLDRYASVYQDRDETRFFRLFAPDAKENGQPLSRIFPIYRQTFRDFEKINYDIRLKEYLVDLNDAMIKVKAEYRLDWNSRQDGKRHTSNGQLSMSLVTDREGVYKIKALNY